MTSPSDTPAAPDVGELLNEAFKGVRDFAYGPGAGMVLRLANALASALASSAAETARLREELETAQRAVRQLEMQVRGYRDENRRLGDDLDILMGEGEREP